MTYTFLYVAICLICRRDAQSIFSFSRLSIDLVQKTLGYYLYLDKNFCAKLFYSQRLKTQRQAQQKWVILNHFKQQQLLERLFRLKVWLPQPQFVSLWIGKHDNYNFIIIVKSFEFQRHEICMYYITIPIKIFTKQFFLEIYRLKLIWLSPRKKHFKLDRINTLMRSTSNLCVTMNKQKTLTFEQFLILIKRLSKYLIFYFNIICCSW